MGGRKVFANLARTPTQSLRERSRDERIDTTPSESNKSAMPRWSEIISRPGLIAEPNYETWFVLKFANTSCYRWRERGIVIGVRTERGRTKSDLGVRGLVNSPFLCERGRDHPRREDPFRPRDSHVQFRDANLV